MFKPSLSIKIDVTNIFNKKFHFLIKHMSGPLYMCNSLGKDKQAMSWFKYQLNTWLSELQPEAAKILDCINDLNICKLIQSGQLSW